MALPVHAFLPRLLSNLAALILLPFLIAIVIDTLLVWQGYTPRAFCTVYPYVDSLIGQVLGLFLAVGGLTWWLFSAFKQRTAFGVMLTGLLVQFAPRLTATLLGMTPCS